MSPQNSGYMMAKKNTPESGNENKIELGMLTDLLGYHLRRAQINTFRQFANTFGKDRVTPTQLTIMILVEQNPGISQVDVGRILDMDRATTMAIIDKLQDRQWLERRKSIQDKRKHALHLTSKGNTALKEMKKEVMNIEKAFVSPLTADEKKQLLVLLKKLL